MTHCIEKPYFELFLRICKNGIEYLQYRFYFFCLLCYNIINLSVQLILYKNARIAVNASCASKSSVNNYMVDENKQELIEQSVGPEVEKIPVDAVEKVDFGQEKIKTPEQESSPEQNIENDSEKIENLPREGEGEIGGIVSVGKVATTQTKRIKEIEEILQDEDTVEAYLAMTPEKRQEFKKVGEETSRKINELMDKTKVKVKKIVDLICKWLSLIPGVNNFFIEQEAKIKADELLKLKRESENFKKVEK